MACVQSTTDRGEAARFQKLPTTIKRQYNTILPNSSLNWKEQTREQTIVCFPSKKAIFESWISWYELEPTHKKSELHTFNVEYFSLLIRSSRACF